MDIPEGELRKDVYVKQYHNCKVTVITIMDKELAEKILGMVVDIPAQNVTVQITATEF